LSEAAGVKAIDALRDARAALVEYQGMVRGALSEAQSEVLRLMTWLQSDRMSFWKQELRRRREQVAQARSDLERARLAAFDQKQSFLDEHRAIRRAQERQDEAEQRVAAVKQWIMRLDREVMMFKGKLQPLGRAADADLERGAARLDLLVERLEAYLRTSPGTPKLEPERDDPS